MAVIIDGHKPNFSDDSLHILKAFYCVKVEEVIAIGLEAFRHDYAESFFKSSLQVVFCESDNDPEYVKDAKETIADLWKELYPWLLAAYRIYPPLRNLIVHHIDYKENHIRIFAYADLP